MRARPHEVPQAASHVRAEGSRAVVVLAACLDYLYYGVFGCFSFSNQQNRATGAGGPDAGQEGPRLTLIGTVPGGLLRLGNKLGAPNKEIRAKDEEISKCK